MGVTTDISAIKGFVEKNDSRLIANMLNGLDFMNDPTIRVIRNLRNPTHLNKLTTQEGVRRLNTEIDSAKGKTKWTRRTITPKFGMKIFNVIPEELRESFMSEMLDPNAKEIPFANWVWQQEFARVAAELNDSIYNSEEPDTLAEFDSGATYSAGDYVYFNDIVYKANATTAAGESPTTTAAKWDDVDSQALLDGPAKIIADAITATDITPVTIGATDETTAYAGFKDQWDQIPEAQKNGGMIAYASYDEVQKLQENQNTKFGYAAGNANIDVEQGRPFLLRNSGGRLLVRPQTWMKDSSRIIMTKQNNLTFGTDQTSALNKVGKLVEHLHGYKAIMKFVIAFQIGDLEVFHCNDLA